MAGPSQPKRASVCVLGSANMDLVVTVDRAPTPGETAVGHEFAQIPGGKVPTKPSQRHGRAVTSACSGLSVTTPSAAGSGLCSKRTESTRSGCT